jgi:hypothetical protein
MPLTKLVVAVLHRALVGTWPLFGEVRPLVLLIATVLTKDIVPSGAAHSSSPFTLHATLVLGLTVLILWIAAALLLVRMRGVRSVGFPPDDHSLAAV